MAPNKTLWDIICKQWEENARMDTEFISYYQQDIEYCNNPERILGFCKKYVQKFPYLSSWGLRKILKEICTEMCKKHNVSKQLIFYWINTRV